jgi:peptidoglycan/LPS O-acetylase OafA/YrhL
VSVVSDRARRIDGLRGVAVTLVVVYHLALNAAPASMIWLRDLLFQGRAGVWVFFVLSGYLIFRPFVIAAQIGERVATMPFLVRRAMRIYPAYLVVLVVLCGFVDTRTLRSPAEWLQAVTLTQNLTGIAYEGQRGVQQAWSLAIEMNFYVFVPFAAMIVARVARRSSTDSLRVMWWSTAAIVGAGFVWQLGARGTIVPMLPNYFPAFGAGMALAIVSVRTPDRLAPTIRWVGTHRGLMWTAAVGVLGLRAWVFDAPEGFDAKQGPEAQLWFTLFGLLLVATTVWSLDAPGLLGRRLPVALGAVSYGVFLWHLMILQRWRPSDWLGTDADLDGNLLVRAALVIPVSVIFATVSWFAVERPCIRWARRVRTPAR